RGHRPALRTQAMNRSPAGPNALLGQTRRGCQSDRRERPFPYLPSAALRSNAGYVAAAVFAAVCLFGGVTPAQEAPKGDVDNGKRAYLAVGCMYCHGRAGQGGAMNYPAPSLAKTELPLEAFKQVLRESLRDMPAYSEAVLADKDIVDMF